MAALLLMPRRVDAEDQRVIDLQEAEERRLTAAKPL
jgi:hypothetical protein